MNLTFEELKEKLAEQFDEIELCEVLKLTPADIVEAFADRIEANRSHIESQIE